MVRPEGSWAAPLGTKDNPAYAGRNFGCGTERRWLHHAPGVIAGFRRQHPDVGLVYVDGDADLDTPGNGSSVLDAMGVAHLLGHAAPELAWLDGPPPLLTAPHLALVGGDPRETHDAGLLAACRSWERQRSARRIRRAGPGWISGAQCCQKLLAGVLVLFQRREQGGCPSVAGRA